MAKRWTVNEKIYALYWGERGIAHDLIARNLNRPIASVKRLLNRLVDSEAGRAERRELVDCHKQLRHVAVLLTDLADTGVDVKAWLANSYPTNDFQAAEMPDEFPLPYNQLKEVH